MTAWVRPLLAVAGVLLTAACLAGFQNALTAGAAGADRLRSALVSTGAALMAAALAGLALAAGSQPWMELLMLGMAVEFVFALADTWLRRRTRA